MFFDGVRKLGNDATRASATVTADAAITSTRAVRISCLHTAAKPSSAADRVADPRRVAAARLPLGEQDPDALPSRDPGAEVFPRNDRRGGLAGDDVEQGDALDRPPANCRPP